MTCPKCGNELFLWSTDYDDVWDHDTIKRTDHYYCGDQQCDVYDEMVDVTVQGSIMWDDD